MRSYVRWIVFLMLIIPLVSFVDKDRPSKGLMLGDMAPNFEIPAINDQSISKTKLSDLKGKYVLLSFWATYDAPSRLQNVNLNNSIQIDDSKIEMISISYDDYQSIFQETIKKDRIEASICYLDPNGQKSKIFKQYQLKSGFTNYLLNENGVIIAKDVSSKDIIELLN